jgi:hydroxymethylbilane synthase
MTTAPALVIATRKSKLALWQAEHVAALLREAHRGLTVELLPMSTKGDRILDRSLAAIGGKGLFIKELEAALEDGRAHLAVHSMKDVPGELPAGMTLAAMLPRADPRDALITRGARGLDDLPRGARLGTSSLRRRAQLLAIRPDLLITTLRGNVETRLKRLDDGELDAIVLAAAGLTRLGLQSRISALLDPSVSLPAVGQGVIGIECRSDDLPAWDAVRALNDAAAHAAVSAERAFARRLGGSCQSPIAAFAELEAQERLTLRGLVAEPDGTRLMRDSIAGSAAHAERLGEALAERLLEAGAGELLERLARA